MRLIVTCDLQRETAFPVNYQEYLAALAYRLLQDSDPEYARFLHDEGYTANAGSRRYKLFTFSGLRAPKGRRRVIGETLWLARGTVEWQVSSPCASFLTHFATGLLSAGGLQVGATLLPVTQAQTPPSPDFSSGMMRFSCMTPIVTSQPVPETKSGKYYLRPSDGNAAFSEALRRNLINKYIALNGQPPTPEEGDEFSLTFDADYLARSPHGGTKKITYKKIEIIGVQVPFTAQGSPRLLEIGYEAGFGELNAGGFGMVEAL